MAQTQETFSKIVRSLLLDLDIHMDQLEQIGYFSKEQRQFLDKFLYKSEEALHATAILRSLHDNDVPMTRLPSYKSSSATLIQSSWANPDNGSGNVTSATLPTLGVIVNELKTDQDALATFLKRCDAHNFSVQVGGANMMREPSVKAKGAEYMLTLDPIAEDTIKDDGIQNNLNANDGSISACVYHDTKMMRHGDENLTRDTDAESIQFETTFQTYNGAGYNPADTEINDTEHMKQKAVDEESPFSGSDHAKNLILGFAHIEVNLLKSANTPVKVELPMAEPFSPASSPSLSITDHTSEAKLADGIFVIKKEEALTVDHSEDEVALEIQEKKIVEEIQTNAWGKPIRFDPTKNKEGTIVGGSAKPLGLDNIGRVMMEKMGWSTGTGLGKKEGGILEPITHVVKTSRGGLRSSEEKKRKPKVQPPAAAAKSTRKSTSSEEGTQKSGLTVTDGGDGGLMSPNTDWEDASERAKADADWVAVKKIAEEVVHNRPPFKGIQAVLIRDPEDPHYEKTIVFKAKIKGKNEYKTTRHYPGVVIKATSPQSSNFLDQKNGFKISCGDHLEILRPHQKDQYHVFNFNQKKRGIVKIALVQMMEKPDDSKVSVSSWTSSP